MRTGRPARDAAAPGGTGRTPGSQRTVPGQEDSGWSREQRGRRAWLRTRAWGWCAGPRLEGCPIGERPGNRRWRRELRRARAHPLPGLGDDRTAGKSLNLGDSPGTDGKPPRALPASTPVSMRRGTNSRSGRCQSVRPGKRLGEADISRPPAVLAAGSRRPRRAASKDELRRKPRRSAPSCRLIRSPPGPESGALGGRGLAVRRRLRPLVQPAWRGLRRDRRGAAGRRSAPPPPQGRTGSVRHATP
jgi:hypothetical protein